MILFSFFYPCRCIICDCVIKPNEPSCNNCIKKYLHKIPIKLLLDMKYEYAAPFIHKGVYREAVLNYKYKDHRQYYLQFSLILKRVIEISFEDITFDYFTAVPCYRIEYPRTKFDRVQLLAKQTARLCNVTYKKLLYQTRDKKQQKSLNREERFENVKDIYKVVTNADITDKTILLFDDVVTTGATVCSAADALMEVGAKKVYIISVTTAYKL